MKTRQWVGIAISLALVGAVLAFALEDDDASALGISLRPLGGVLLVAAILVLGWLAIVTLGSGEESTRGSNGPGNFENIKAIGGLIAVVSGITAVATLAIVTLTQLGSDEKESTVAIATSAFGVISAVVGAYLGIKVTAEHSTNVAEGAKQETQVAEQQTESAKQEAQVATSTLQAVTSKVDELVDPDKAAQVKAAGFEAGEAASQGTGGS